MAEESTGQGVIIEYRTPDHRFGQRFGVTSAALAAEHHPDAVIIGPVTSESAVPVSVPEMVEPPPAEPVTPPVAPPDDESWGSV